MNSNGRVFGSSCNVGSNLSVRGVGSCWKIGDAPPVPTDLTYYIWRHKVVAVKSERDKTAAVYLVLSRYFSETFFIFLPVGHDWWATVTRETIAFELRWPYVVLSRKYHDIVVMLDVCSFIHSKRSMHGLVTWSTIRLADGWWRSLGAYVYTRRAVYGDGSCLDGGMKLALENRPKMATDFFRNYGDILW